MNLTTVSIHYTTLTTLHFCKIYQLLIKSKFPNAIFEEDYHEHLNIVLEKTVVQKSVTVYRQICLNCIETKPNKCVLLTSSRLAAFIV